MPESGREYEPHCGRADIGGGGGEPQEGTAQGRQGAATRSAAAAVSIASQLRTEIKQEMISWVRQSTASSCNISFYNKVPNFHLLLLFLFSTDSQLSDNNLN